MGATAAPIPYMGIYAPTLARAQEVRLEDPGHANRARHRIRPPPQFTPTRIAPCAVSSLIPLRWLGPVTIPND